VVLLYLCRFRCLWFVSGGFWFWFVVLLYLYSCYEFVCFDCDLALFWLATSYVVLWVVLSTLCCFLWVCFIIVLRYNYCFCIMVFVCVYFVCLWAGLLIFVCACCWVLSRVGCWLACWLFIVSLSLFAFRAVFAFWLFGFVGLFYCLLVCLMLLFS